MKIDYKMPVYKGKDSKRPVLKAESDFKTGKVFETRVEMNMHTGTHMDMPLHVFPNGNTIDTLQLEKVVTKCKVLDFKDIDGKISKESFKDKDISEGDFILLKTKNSFFDILESEFIYLDKSGAEYLRDKKIKGLGIDGLGIERNQPGHESHKILLGAGIVMLEGLRLGEVEEDVYLLAAAPINIAGAEAAPVRAILIK
jgi:arylformamidase